MLLCLLSLCFLPPKTTKAQYDDWTTIGQGPVERSEATTIRYQGDFYLFNGFDGKIDIYNRVEKYDPRTNSYTLLTPMPTIDGQLSAVTHNGIAIVGDVIWIVGGRIGDHPGKVTDQVWLYDISDDSWSQGPTLPIPAGGGGLGLLGRELHYVGGFDPQAQCDTDIHVMYDLDNPAVGWQDLTSSSPMPMARNHFAAVVLDGKLYTVGGQNGHDGCGGAKDNALVHAYDPATDSWTRLPDLPGPQSHAEPSTFAYKGKVVSVGGQVSGGKGVWEYDPSTNAWTVNADMELPRPLLAPSAGVFGGNLYVLNGGSPTVGQPRNETLVKTYDPDATGGGDAGAVSIYLEAECGNVGTNWEEKTSSSASNDSYVTIANGNNSHGSPPTAAADVVTLSATIEEAGDYRLFARIDAPSSGDDSFWVKVGNGDWIKWWQGLQSNGFEWREVDQSPFALPAGEVSIQFAYREDGTLLDKLYLTNTDKLPSGQDDEAENCTPPPPPAGTTTVRINAGGPAVNYEGETFAADANFAGGKTYANMSATVPALYQTERSSNSPFQYGYTIPVEEGTYDVRLHFAEIYFGANGGGPAGSGQRVFDVSLEGQTILDNYDINADVGPQTVTVKEYRVTVSDGAINLFFDASASAGGTDQPKLSALEIIGVDAPGNTDQSPYWAEAECAEDGQNWPSETSGGTTFLAYPGNKNLPPPASGSTQDILTFTPTLNGAGSYELYFRMNTPTTGENSFWVSIDGGDWIKFWQEVGGEQLLTSGFEWREVNDDGKAIDFDLAAGPHTIAVAPRETGTELDKIYLVRAGNGAPTGQGEAGVNCNVAASAFSTSSASVKPTVASELSLDVYPNPAASVLNLGITGFSEGRVTVRIIDINGRAVQERQYSTDQGGGLISQAVDVSDLPAGMYRLDVNDTTRRIGRTFVKGR